MQEVQGIEELDIKKVSIVKFGAIWCESCRRIEKKLSKLEKDFNEFDFKSLDVDKHLDLADEYGVNELPVVIAFKNGKEISRWNEPVGDIADWLKFLTI